MYFGDDTLRMHERLSPLRMKAKPKGTNPPGFDVRTYARQTAPVHRIFISLKIIFEGNSFHSLKD